MHIKENLVYDKHTGKMIGFIDLGDINNHLLASLTEDNTETLANSMMVIMVKSQLQFPYVQFPCTNVKGDLLFYPFWQTIFRLERMGFKVGISFQY